MIIGIDSSKAVCTVLIRTDGATEVHEWEIGRGLADNLIGYLRERLVDQNASWADITGLAVYKGPGSFTGLRIGLTVFNTIADTSGVPIVGETGESWFERAVTRLESGENDGLVMPLYGQAPNITKPRK